VKVNAELQGVEEEHAFVILTEAISPIVPELS
jgi:hypothetical protein